MSREEINLKNRKKHAVERSSRLFLVFVGGSVIGFLIEGVWSIFIEGHWINHSATVWGPFCIIYGLGALMLYALASRLRRRPMPSQFVICALSGAVVEYFASLFQEKVFGSTSWDYSGQLLNIGGRVSLKMTVLWGALGLFFVNAVYPLVGRVLEGLGGRVFTTFCAALFLIVCFDLTLSAFAVNRWRERTLGIADGRESAVDAYLDTHFGDERMRTVFSNMTFKKNN